MPTMVPSVLGLLLLVVLVAIGLPLVRGRGRAARAVRPVVRPACPGCGYDAAGLVRPACPECGRDLESGGVVDRRDPPRTRLAAARATTLLLLAAATWPPLTAALDALLPERWTWTIAATVIEDGVPVLVERTRVVWARGKPPRAAFPPGRVRVVLPGAVDRVLLEDDEAAIAMMEPAERRAAIESSLASTRSGVPTDVAAAIAGLLAGDDLVGVDWHATMHHLLADFAVPRRFSLHSHNYLVRRRALAAWPALAAALGCGLGLAGGLVLVARDWRRGDPVPWSAVVDRGAGPREDDVPPSPA